MRRNPYASFLDKLQKPARYIGGEHFQVVKEWEKCKSKIALCFPDTYEIGMSHLGMKILYEEINSKQDLIAERCFAPWTDAEKEIRDRNLPLVTLESFRPLAEFDLVGFSLQYEMSYTNILNMLDMGSIPIWQKDRKESDPLVIVGGPCATHPEPIAPFVDMVIVGDGEKILADICEHLAKLKEQKLSRIEILKEFQGWTGIYVPSLYQTKLCDKSKMHVVEEAHIKRYLVENLKDYSFPERSPIPHLSAIFDRFSVEISRGCAEGCRFCQAGMIYRPVRERDPLKIKKSILDGMKYGGFDDASLTCLSTTDYSAITPLLSDLLDELAKRNGKLGLSSLRAYGLDKVILEKLGRLKSTSITLAPEAGSERLRDVINKNVTEDDLVQAAKDLFSRGWKKMKLYFMIGLPTEIDEDVRSIMKMGKTLRWTARQLGLRNPGITISVSTFVPKPHTPFQWCKMIDLREIDRKQEMLWQDARSCKLQYKKHVSKISRLEGIVSRGDRKIGDLIYSVWASGGRFDGWVETFDYELWIKKLEELEIDPDIYLRELPTDGGLPWDHIDLGIDKSFLLKEYEKAMKEQPSLPCGKPKGEKVHFNNLKKFKEEFFDNKRKLVCHNCGQKCDLSSELISREDFLKKLGAENEIVLDATEIESPLTRQNQRGQNVGITYRINYSKIGPISLISNLDLQKVVARIFKRTEIDLLYSEGFNTHPLISFGSALTLGVSSISEYFDVRVPEQWQNPEKILASLQENSEQGIILKGVEEITRKTPSIQVQSKAFRYFIPINNQEDIDKVISDIMGSDSLKLQSYSKKDKRDIEKEIRPLIKDMQRSRLDLPSELINLIDEVSSCKDMEGIDITVAIVNGSSIRPIEILNFLKENGLSTERPIKLDIIL